MSAQWIWFWIIMVILYPVWLLVGFTIIETIIDWIRHHGRRA